MMQALANSAAFWVLAVLALVYLLPTVIGAIRGVNQLALVNLIGAPTGIGWIAALILAFGPRRLPPEPPPSAWRPSAW